MILEDNDNLTNPRPPIGYLCLGGPLDGRKFCKPRHRDWLRIFTLENYGTLFLGGAPADPTAINLFVKEHIYELVVIAPHPDIKDLDICVWVETGWNERGKVYATWEAMHKILSERAARTPLEGAPS